MAILLDVLMVLLFVLCVWSGWRRGFVKVLGGVLALVAATLVSVLFSASVADAVADKVSLQLPLVQLICSVALFAVTFAVVSFVLRSLDVVAKIPLIKQLNKVLGLAVGVLSGVLWVWFAINVLKLVAPLGWIPALTPAVLGETRLITWLGAMLPAMW